MCRVNFLVNCNRNYFCGEYKGFFFFYGIGVFLAHLLLSYLSC